MLTSLQQRNLKSTAYVAVGVLVTVALLVSLAYATAQAGRTGAADSAGSAGTGSSAETTPVVEPEVQVEASGRQGKRPNIIFLMTDDQAVDDTRVMHKLERKLGRRGTTFTQAFSPYPLCCPARATLLTGQYAQNHHVLGNTPPYGGFPAFDDSSTLPIWLKSAGYTTAILGKYLNSYPGKKNPRYVPPGWDNWRVPIKKIYNYRDWTLNVDGEPRKYSGQYQTDFVGQEAVDLVKKFSRQEKPYFMWVGFLAPHIGAPQESDDPRRHGSALGTPNVSDRYRDVYKNVPLPDKRSINEKNVSDKPRWISHRKRRPPALLTEINQQRLESLRSVDDAVARIVRAVKKQGDLKNTIFIFTSDNGHMTGEHRRIGKVVGYEESARVPLIVAGPGFDTGSTRSQKVSLVDIAPTIARLAGAKPGLVQDGVPLMRFAKNPRFPDTRSMLFQAGPKGRKPERWYTAIRTKRFIFVKWVDNERELYDLRTDPEQLRNVAGNPRYAALEADLAATLATLKDCAGENCLTTVPRTTKP